MCLFFKVLAGQSGLMKAAVSVVEWQRSVHGSADYQPVPPWPGCTRLGHPGYLHAGLHCVRSNSCFQSCVNWKHKEHREPQAAAGWGWCRAGPGGGSPRRRQGPGPRLVLLLPCIAGRGSLAQGAAVTAPLVPVSPCHVCLTLRCLPSYQVYNTEVSRYFT